MPEREPSRLATGRHAGVLVPLFSIPSRSSWGIGEIPDLITLGRWLGAAGLHFVQLLPVNEMQEGQSSPYSALSAMAIDPVFIALHEVEEFVELGGEQALAARDRTLIDAVRVSAAIDYGSVRAAKNRALRSAFTAFLDRHWTSRSARAAAFTAFKESERWWLDDYALFRALHDEHHAQYWIEWEPDLRHREQTALTTARDRLWRSIAYYEYLQWIADEQWQRARRECGSVGIFGDFPFMVSGHSADVWARQHEFRLDASIGTPPDAFSETGQNWGLPVYRWDVIAEGGYQWLRDRSRRCAELYDGFRIDHLVGFYRTFVRERNGITYFVPPDEPSQRAQGERLLTVLGETGSRLFAEDLGTVPDFVRESLAARGIPGFKVLRWEREWHVEGKPFRDPAGYPRQSVATTGTHDTETLAEWWDSADLDERAASLRIPSLGRARCEPHQPFSARMRDAILDVLFGAGSDLLVLPIQDVFGWRDRINTPASVNQTNWTWRLPWAVEDLLSVPEARERAQFLRNLAEKHGRG